MPRLMMAALALALAAAPALAQQEPIYVSSSHSPDVRQLPRDVADEVIRYYNAAGTLRFSGLTRIPTARGIDGDVAVLGGPVTMAGRISGSLYVINGDVTFEPGAVVGGDVLVVGGTIDGQSNVAVAGALRGYRDVLRYRREGDELVYAPQRDGWARWRRQHAAWSAGCSRSRNARSREGRQPARGRSVRPSDMSRSAVPRTMGSPAMRRSA